MKMRFEFDKIAGREDLKERIGKKFASLEKYLTHVKQDFHSGVVKVLRGDRYGYKVKVDVRLPGKEVVAESSDATLMNAVDQAYDKSARRIRKYFEKMKDKKK
jgi:ribosomal subunit interface protein